MSYTPVEIRHVKLPRTPGGYRRAPVDHLLEEIASSFETVWRERADHADRVELLEGELTRYRELEGLLRTTLVSAERAAHELRDQANREAETIVTEARAEGRLITREARAEHEHLTTEARRVRLLLHAALDALEEADAGELELQEPPQPPVAGAEQETRAA
ncbi:MAG TPA: DivIVA domain-containing protein [Gaiellaceae bacterium]|jgi:cell division initiation protein